MPAKTPFRVILVDDHAMLREGLKALLRLNEDIQVVGEAASGEEALRLLDLMSCDFVLLDHSLPDAEGVALLQKILSRHPEISVLMLTAHTESELVSQALESGARGFLPKTATPDELHRALLAVREGGTFLHPTLVQGLVQARRRQSDAPAREKISDRERDVLVRVARGLSNSEIGQELYLSESTVKTHLRNLYRKLDVNNRSELVFKAMSEGMLEQSSVSRGGGA